jgi:dihydrofolate reductase
LFDWYYSGDTPSKYNSRRIAPFPEFKLSKEDVNYFDRATGEIGAVLAGRRTYDLTKGWGGTFYIPAPLFVLTHEPPSQVPEGQTQFVFVREGLESAVDRARAVAKDKMVYLVGANVAKQCIERGLLDELRVHIAPMLLGDGVRLFDFAGSHLVGLKRTKVIESPSGTTHIHYQIVS